MANKWREMETNAFQEPEVDESEDKKQHRPITIVCMSCTVNGVCVYVFLSEISIDPQQLCVCHFENVI